MVLGLLPVAEFLESMALPSEVFPDCSSYTAPYTVLRLPTDFTVLPTENSRLLEGGGVESLAQARASLHAALQDLGNTASLLPLPVPQGGLAHPPSPCILGPPSLTASLTTVWLLMIMFSAWSWRVLTYLLPS